MNIQMKKAAFAVVLAFQAVIGSAAAGEFDIRFGWPQAHPSHHAPRLPRVPEQPAGRTVAGVYELQLPPGMQSFAFDDARNETYVLSVEKTNGREESTISRFPTVMSARERAIDSAPAVPFIGHQGLGLEYGKGNDVRLWTSVRDNPYQAARFRYDRGDILDVQFYTLFPDSFFDKNETLPTVCDGQRYLAVRGRRSGNHMVIRLFDLHKLAARGPGDYSDAFAYEWEVDPSITRQIDGATQGVQSLACDEQRVYILAGSSSSKTPKRIHIYTLNGTLVRKNEDIAIGMDTAQRDPGGYFYEPEGLSFRHRGPAPELFMGVVSGPGRKHINRLWPVDLE